MSDQTPDGYHIAQSAGRYQAQLGEQWIGPPRQNEPHAIGDAIQHDKGAHPTLGAEGYALLRLRGMGPHDRLQTRCWLPGHPEVGASASLTPAEALAWCLSNPLPDPTQHAIGLIIRGDSQWAAEDAAREKRQEEPPTA